MEYRDDYNQKIPFYMTYPMQNMYLTEMEYEKDMERMKELYPREVRRLQEMVEKRCDEMEYEGSRMYDENPDRHMLEEEAWRLYERFIRENPQYHIMTPSRPGMPPESGMMPSRPGMPPESGMMPSRPGMSPESGMMPSRPGMPMEPGMMQPRPGMSPESGMMQPRPEMPPEPRPVPRWENLSQNDDMQMQQFRRRQDDSWLRSLISILFHDEIYRRRCRNRRCRRWW